MLRIVVLSVLALLAGPTPNNAQRAPGPLPPVSFPVENPLLPEQDILGKFLFWDEQLSHDNSVACGTCHRHEAGGTDPRSGADTLHPGPDALFGTADDIVGSPGVSRVDHATGRLAPDPLFHTRPQVTRRKAPSVINAAYHETLFWDGRATGSFVDPQTGAIAIADGGALESQAATPILSPVEMSSVGRTWDQVVAKLAQVDPLALATDIPADMTDFLAEHPTYPDMFAAVYGDPQITARRIAFAIANYERTLVSDETIVDDFLRGAIPSLPTAQLEHGWALYHGDAKCFHCHAFPGTNGGFFNIGVRPDDEDVGRMAVTGDPLDKGRFKSPGLRNASLKGRLFHNGGALHLAGAIDLYKNGGFFDDGNQDPLITPLGGLLKSKDLLAIRVLIRDGLLDERVASGRFPFTRPTLRSELRANTRRLGVASPDGGGGFAWFVLPGPPNAGNDGFLLGLTGAVRNSPALLVLAGQPVPGGTLHPDPQTPVPVNIDLSTIIAELPATTDTRGVASVHLPLPPDPALVGLRFYAQWFIADPHQENTGGVYGTHGIEVEVF